LLQTTPAGFVVLGANYKLPNGGQSPTVTGKPFLRKIVVALACPPTTPPFLPLPPCSHALIPADTSSNPANLNYYSYFVIGACVPLTLNSNGATIGIIASYNAGSTTVTAGSSSVPPNGVVLDSYASTSCSGTPISTNSYLGASVVNGPITVGGFVSTLPTIPGVSVVNRWVFNLSQSCPPLFKLTRSPTYLPR